jgi:hypothetical protein
MKVGIEKLTLIIETTNGNDISKDVLKSISTLQRIVSYHNDIKLSLSFNGEKHHNLDKYCPANWNYWPI